MATRKAFTHNRNANINYQCTLHQSSRLSIDRCKKRARLEAEISSSASASWESRIGPFQDAEKPHDTIVVSDSDSDSEPDSDHDLSGPSSSTSEESDLIDDAQDAELNSLSSVNNKDDTIDLTEDDKVSTELSSGGPNANVVGHTTATSSSPQTTHDNSEASSTEFHEESRTLADPAEIATENSKLDPSFFGGCDADYIDLCDDSAVEVLDESIIFVRSQSTSHPGFKELNSFHLFPGTDSTVLRRGTFVELRDGEFLRITTLLQSAQSTEVFLQGQRYRRLNKLDSMFDEDQTQEICQLIVINEEDVAPFQSQGISEIPLGIVLRKRQLRSTNTIFPGFRGFQNGHQSTQDSDEVLVCRWKYICTYEDASALKAGRWKEKALLGLRFEEADQEFRVPDEELRKSWRGHTQIGGSHRREAASADLTDDSAVLDSYTPHVAISHSIQKTASVQNFGSLPKRFIDLTLDDNAESSRPLAQQYSLKRSHTGEIKSSTLDAHTATLRSTIPKSFSSPASLSSQSNPRSSKGDYKRVIASQYTFGDAFCGAGGTSRGAQTADLRLVWAFDASGNACQTYRSNFRSTRVFEQWADDFIRHSRGAKVDILHLSPPCQPFSHAHTIPGKNDEQNRASLFAVGDVIDKSKPRVATLEQTAGLMSIKEHWYYWQSLLRMYTSRGFNLRWRRVNCATYGLPQERKRLIIISSCPGEMCPDFPKQTHSADGAFGLKPFTTINQALRKIKHNAPNHNIAYASQIRGFPYDGDKLLPACVTTSGGGNYHPEGRDLTHRELASLQTFPSNHVFKGSEVKKQIGNAVPPCVARVIFKKIIEHLKEQDQKMARN